jgi:hypothetical protein
VTRQLTQRAINAAAAFGVVLAIGACQVRAPAAGRSQAPAVQATPVAYTQAQADECVPAREALNASLFKGLALITAGDVQRNREKVVRYIDETLEATAAVEAPTVAAAEWVAAVEALRVARPVFSEPMTKAQYAEAIKALAVTPAEFDDKCKSVIRWVADNLPH